MRAIIFKTRGLLYHLFFVLVSAEVLKLALYGDLNLVMRVRDSKGEAGEPYNMIGKWST